MTRLIHKLALAVASGLVASAVACKPPPPTYESDLLETSLPECEGLPAPDVVRAGDRVTLRVARGGQLHTVDWRSGILEEGGELVTGGEPLVSVTLERVCADGTLQGDACLEALWARGQCWDVAEREP